MKPRAGDFDSFCSKLSQSNHKRLVRFPISISVIQVWVRVKVRVRFHQIKVRRYDAKSRKIWPMGREIALTSHLIGHPILVGFFKDIASYPETWIWWNRTQVKGHKKSPKLQILFRAWDTWFKTTFAHFRIEAILQYDPMQVNSREWSGQPRLI